MIDLLLYILAGAGVGFAVGVTGVGGGSLMTPLLLLFGFPLHVAIGTDLLYASVTKAGGMVVHARQGTVNWRLVGLLAATSIPCSAATVYALHAWFGAPESYAPLLTTTLGVMLIVTAAAIALRGRLQGDDAAGPVRRWTEANAAALTLLMGAVLGVCVTLSSVGAGAFGAAVLMAIYPGLRAVGVVGTDIAHAVPLTFIAGLGHLALGHVDFGLLGALLVGSLPAIWLGSRIAERLPERVMRPLLATLLMGLGVKFALG